MTTRDIQREETKKRIYDVAFKLFDEFGYDKVKVSDIAKAANVSVGSVYYHYKNKEAIIDYGYYEFDQMLKEAYEKQTFNSEREAILFLIDFQIKDVFLDIGLKMTTICFKNQINAENTCPAFCGYWPYSPAASWCCWRPCRPRWPGRWPHRSSRARRARTKRPRYCIPSGSGAPPARPRTPCGARS